MIARSACFCAALILLQATLTAQTPWKLPPPEIVKILDAPPTPGVRVDPHGRWLLLSERAVLPPLADLARPMLRLAGHRIDPATNGPHGPRTTIGYRLVAIADGKETKIDLPPEGGFGPAEWSPAGDRFAFTRRLDDRIECLLAATDQSPVLTFEGVRLNAVSGSPIEWMPDGRSLLLRTVPEGRGPAPERPVVPGGPNAQETSGPSAPVRTLQDLLKDPHDEALFEYYATSQLAMSPKVTQEGCRPVGIPAIFAGVSPSPDGRFLLVTRIVRPFSYLVASGSFPQVVEVWDLEGRVVREICRRPLQDQVPIEGVITGPREIRWSPQDDATLVWTEALDGGDPKKKAEKRDRLMRFAAPWAGDPAEILRTEHRLRGVEFLETQDGALVTEFDRDRRWQRTWVCDLGKPEGAPRLLWDRSMKDRYGDPGRPWTVPTPRGRRVVAVREGALLLLGRGASPAGDRPFLDRMDLASGKTARLWWSSEGAVESVDEILAQDASSLLVVRESRTEPPNWSVLDARTGKRRALTSFTDPAPELRDVRQELLTYERKDGVKLSGTLYVPGSWKEGQRLPLVVWAYPEEFNDPATAGQVSGSPHRFVRPGGASHLFLLTQGYAVLDGAAMPVVGPPDKANDTFVEQIVGSAQAAIDQVAAMGIADPQRVGVGGHSYGAFMTANLLAHCDLFKAGVARSGAYNRTLTPFGFQNERRTFWESPETYVAMSPFAHAHRINEPLLLIHGEMDSNPGTFPIQSDRLFQAIKGHGGSARLVTLPFESHGYQARESVMHTLAEMVTWFDRHLKADQ